MKPEISVVMSVYNDEKYLPFAIESILSQTFANFEFIIIDDGSSDSSSEIIYGYQKKDKRIVFFKNIENIGLAKSLNKGLNIATGDYYARQDADDISHSKRLRLQYDFIKSNPEYKIIGSDCGIIDMRGNFLYSYDFFSKQNNLNAFQTLLSGNAIFPHGSVLIDITLLRSFNGYNEDFYFSQDRELWLRMTAKGARVYVVSEPLYYFRKKPLRFKGKVEFRLKINFLLNEYFLGRISEKEFQLQTKAIFSTCSKEVLKQENPYFLSDYWYSIALSSLRSDHRFSIWKFLIFSLKEKNNFIRNFIRIVSFALPFLPHSLTHKFKYFIKNYKSNT